MGKGSILQCEVDFPGEKISTVPFSSPPVIRTPGIKKPFFSIVYSFSAHFMGHIQYSMIYYM